MLGQTIVALVVLFATRVAAADSPQLGHSNHESRAQQIQAGFTMVQYWLPLSSTSSDRAVFELSYRRTLADFGVDIIGGARVAYGDPLRTKTALEMFAGLALASRSSRWRPSISVELGYSRAGTTRDDPGTVRERVKHPHPLYMQMSGAPARFAIDRVRLEVFGIGIGTSVIEAGRAMRIELRVLRIGWAF